VHKVGNKIGCVTVLLGE